MSGPRPSRTAQRRLNRLEKRSSPPAASPTGPAFCENGLARNAEVPAITFPANGISEAQTIEFPDLVLLPNLRGPLLEIIEADCSRHSSGSSRNAIANAWKFGLIKFLLSQRENDIGPNDISPALISRYIWWLNRTSDEGLAVLKVSSRRSYLNKVLGTIASARSGNPESPFIHDLGLANSPWRGESKRPKRDQGHFMGVDDMTTLLRFCRLQIERTMQFDGAPETDGVPSSAPEAAAPPTIEGLMPFMVVLSHYTRFNPAVLLNIRLDGIRRVSFGGIERIIITSLKARSDGDPQIAAFAIDGSSTNPWVLLEFIRRWTEPSRGTIQSDFLFVAETDTGPVELTRRNAKEGNLLTQPFRKLARRAGIPMSRMTDIRRGWMDLAHLKSDGDPTVGGPLAGHRDIDTADRHYKSPAGIERDAELLANGMAEQQRWLETDGRIDARRYPDKADRSAATPGFFCSRIDHLNSPMPGQRSGRPCTAYSRCPICPCAKIDVRSPRSCGYAHLLLDRIETSFDVGDAMSAARFLGVYAPVARRLRDFWLPAFSDEVREQASILDLPMLPELD